MLINSTLKVFSSPSLGLGRANVIISFLNAFFHSKHLKNIGVVLFILTGLIHQVLAQQPQRCTNKCTGSGQYINGSEFIYDANTGVVTNGQPTRQEYLSIRDNRTFETKNISRASPGQICDYTLIVGDVRPDVKLTLHDLPLTPENSRICGFKVAWNVYRSDRYLQQPAITCSTGGIWQDQFFTRFFGTKVDCGEMEVPACACKEANPCPFNPDLNPPSIDIKNDGFYYVYYTVYDPRDPSGTGTYSVWMPFFYVKREISPKITVDQGFPKILCGPGSSTQLKITNPDYTNSTPPRIIWYKNGVAIADGQPGQVTYSVSSPGIYSAYICRPAQQDITICCPKSSLSNKIEIKENNTPPDFKLVQNEYLEGCNPEQILSFELDNVSCPTPNCKIKASYTYGDKTENISIPNDRFNVNVLNAPGTITVTMTDAVGCETTKTINIVPVEGCCPAIPARGANFGSITSSALRLQGGLRRANLQFSGVLTIDEDVNFKDMELTFGPDARIVMDANHTLTFNNCKLNCCSNRMWQGIYATAGNVRLINGTTLACAEIGISLSQDAKTTVNSSTLDRNNNHIVINRSDDAVTLNGATFRCSAPLVAPFAGEITKTAIKALGDGQNQNDVPLDIRIGSGNPNSIRNHFSGCVENAIEVSNYNLTMQNNTIDLGNSQGTGVSFIPFPRRPVTFTAQSGTPYENIIQNAENGIQVGNSQEGGTCILNIQQCKISNIRDNGIGIQNTTPTSMAVNARIRYNSVTNCSIGIFLMGLNPVTRFEISNNSIYDCKEDGISGFGFFFSNQTPIRSLQVSENYIYNIQRYGLRLQGFSTDDDQRVRRVDINLNTVENVGLAPLFYNDPQNGLSVNMVGGGIKVGTLNFTGTTAVDINIQGNTIQNLEGVQPMYFGVMIEGYDFKQVSFNINPFTYPNQTLEKNVIRNAYRGIFGTSLQSAVIDNNEMYDIKYMSVPLLQTRLEASNLFPFYRYAGGIVFNDVSTVNGINRQITNNNISSGTSPISLPLTDPKRFGGISIWGNGNNNICNNDIIDFSQSVRFSGLNTFPNRLMLNKFRNYRVGVELFNNRNGGIGNQYKTVVNGGPNNIPPRRVEVWNNEFYPDVNNPPSAGIFTNTFVGLTSEWAVRNSGLPYHPLTSIDAQSNSNCPPNRGSFCSVPVVTSPIYTISRELTDCNRSRGILNPGDGLPRYIRLWEYSDDDINALVKVAQLQINNPPSAADYMAKQNLYEILSVRTDVKSAFVTLDSFYVAQQGTNLARLYEIHSLMDSAQRIPLIRKIVCLPPNSTDTLSVSCPVKNALRRATLNQALALNSAVVPVNLMESNHKAINEIRINQLLNFTIELNPTQEAMVTDIGQQCVSYGGKAVTEAIQMHFVRERFNISFIDTCNLVSPLPPPVPLPKQGEVVVLAQNPTFELYPNPAQNECTVSYRSPEGISATVKVYNAAGAEIGTWHLKEKEDVVTLNTSKWAEGIYIAFFNASDGTSHTQKLIIIR